MSYTKLKELDFEPLLLQLANFLHYRTICMKVELDVGKLFNYSTTVTDFYKVDNSLHTQVADRHYQVFKVQVDTIHGRV